MTNPEHPLVGRRVRLTDKSSFPETTGAVAIVGVPDGHAEPWALVIADPDERGEHPAFAYPIGQGYLEEVEALDVSA